MLSWISPELAAWLESLAGPILSFLPVLLMATVGADLYEREFSPAARRRRAIAEMATKGRTVAERAEKRRRNKEVERLLAEEEFVASIGIHPREYRRQTIFATFVTAALVIVATGSWAVVIAVLIAIPAQRSGRTVAIIEKARSRAASEDLVPAARSISALIGDGMSLAEAIGEYTRTTEGTTLQASLRAAIASPDSLEIGLRAEANKARFRIVRDFLEILAEGASASTRGAVTAAGIERFAEVSARRQAALRTTLNKTSQARLNRRLVLVMIPLSLMITSFQVGLSTFFGTFGGNLLIFIVSSMIGMAIIVSDRLINRATAQF